MPKTSISRIPCHTNPLFKLIMDDYLLVPDLSEFVLLGIHTDPDKADEEISSLVVVHDEIKKKWKTNDIIMMGDLNAEGAYVSKKSLNSMELRNNPEYQWLIPDSADTTTTDTDCAYDRQEKFRQFMSGIYR